MALPLLSHTNEYVFGRGRLYVALFDASGYSLGERFLGNCPGFSLTVEIEKFEHVSSTSGISTTDLTVTLSVKFSASIVCDDLTAANLALFTGGTVGTITQSATPVTNERIRNPAPGYEYQLGEVAPNYVGVRGVSSVAVSSYEGDNATTWAVATAKAVGAVVKPTTPNSHWYMCTVAGTTHAATEPTWPTNGSTVAESGGPTWQDMGLIAYVADTDYKLDAASGRIAVMTTGAIATYYALLPSGISSSLNVDYTATAGSRVKIDSGTSGAIEAKLRYIADNAAGTNRDLVISSCSIAPEGELPFITEGDLASMTLGVGVNTRDTSTPQIIIAGQTVS